MLRVGEKRARVSHRGQARLVGENDTQVEAWGLTSGIGMVSFPIDQGQEAAGIEVQVVVVGIWVQIALRNIVREAGRGGRTGDWKTNQEASVMDKVKSNVTQQQ